MTEEMKRGIPGGTASRDGLFPATGAPPNADDADDSEDSVSDQSSDIALGNDQPAHGDDRSESRYPRRLWLGQSPGDQRRDNERAARGDVVPTPILLRCPTTGEVDTFWDCVEKESTGKSTSLGRGKSGGRGERSRRGASWGGAVRAGGVGAALGTELGEREGEDGDENDIVR